MEEVNKLGKILIVDDNEDVLFALNLFWSLIRKR